MSVYLRRGIAGSHGNSVSNSIKLFSTVARVFKCLHVPILAVFRFCFLDFLILAILVCVTWYLTVVLICVLLMTNVDQTVLFVVVVVAVFFFKYCVLYVFDKEVF